MKRRIMCLLLTLLFLATLLPLPQAEAAHPRVSLSDLREKFPNGTYWNHHSGYNNPNGYSTTPCGHSHGNCDYYGGCGCNSFDNAIQCMGYSYKLGYDYYGTSVKTWPKAYSLADLKPGDVVSLREKSRSSDKFKELAEQMAAVIPPKWLDVDTDNFTAKMIMLPERADVDFPFEEQLIIELYSK